MGNILSKLDGPQVLQLVVDEAQSALRIVGSITAAPPTGVTDVMIDHVDDSVAIGTTATLFTGTSAGSQFGLDVNVLNPTTGIALTGSISGTFQPTGLNTGLSSTAIFATSAVQFIPVIAGQNGVSIRVWNPTNAVVYFGASTVTSDNGYPKVYREEIIADARDTPGVYIYFVTEGAATAELRVLNIA